MRSHLNGFTGMIMMGINNKINRNALRKIREDNEINQKIVRYCPSQIEAFIDEAVPVENMLISGGSYDIRNRAICRAIECAAYQGYRILVLHSGNVNLEQNLSVYFGTNKVCLINRCNPVYDPFVGATNSEIARLVISSANNNCKINAVGRYYLSGIADYIRCNNKSPRCYMYINCPHLMLMDRINDAENRGLINQSDSRKIISQILQGEVERGGIENFFHELALQSNGILADKTNALRAVSLMTVSRNNQILSVDVQSNTNQLLVNLLINETESVRSGGNKMLVVIDSINVSSGNLLTNYIKQSGSNSCAIISSDDAFSEFGGSNDEFYAFVGKCSKLIVSKHSSAYSCQKLSDVIGSYDKQEISRTFTETMNYMGKWGISSGESENISIKRDQIVKPEEIQRLNNEEVYIIDKQSGELAYTTVI